MTFRTSKERPSEAQALEGAYTLILKGVSVNRVDPIDTALSYWCRKNALIMGCISQEQAGCSGIGYAALNVGTQQCSRLKKCTFFRMYRKFLQKF